MTCINCEHYHQEEDGNIGLCDLTMEEVEEDWDCDSYKPDYR